MIELKNLTKRFGNVVAVNRLNLSVSEGEIFGFIQHSQIYIYTLSLSVLDVKRFHNVRKRAGICSGIFTSPTVK